MDKVLTMYKNFSITESKYSVMLNNSAFPRQNFFNSIWPIPNRGILVQFQDTFNLD